MLGHALFMKAIHGGKAKNDKLDSEKLPVVGRSPDLHTRLDRRSPLRPGETYGRKK